MPVVVVVERIRRVGDIITALGRAHRRQHADEGACLRGRRSKEGSNDDAAW